MSKLLFFMTVLCHVHYSSLLRYSSLYECGPHGQFEYCIDGFPGCVVGCHCHPGFYFDTVTKICEPSSKLIGSNMRFYSPSPSIVREIPKIVTSTTIKYKVKLPAVAVTESIPQENKEAVLGDWLFNQFSKRIESELRNKTKQEKNTRRSAPAAKKKVVKRKPKVKNNKNTKKAQKNKNHSKQARRVIDENDSLFESDSDSDDSRRSLSDEGSPMKSDDDIDSDNSKKQDDNDKSCADDGKKIIIIKKSPKQPLPPLIFLNQGSDGLLFPPPGMPQLPPMPMFPILPVPPMMPIIAFPGMYPTATNNSSTATVANSSATAANSSATVANSSATVANSSATVANSSATVDNSSTTTTNSSIHSRIRMDSQDFEDLNRKRKNRKKIRTSQPKNEQESTLKTLKAEGKKHSSMASRYVSFNPSISSPQSTGIEDIDSVKRQRPDSGGKAENKFQYMTDLIHQLNTPTKQGRRMNDAAFSVIPKIKNIASNEHALYTNLGKEVVSLMKQMEKSKSDSDAYHTDDESIPAFNSKLIWERQIRSAKANTKDVSNNSLRELERKASEAVTSVPGLNLLQLEDMIKNVNDLTKVKSIEELTMNSHNINTSPTPFTSPLKLDLFKQFTENPMQYEYLSKEKDYKAQVTNPKVVENMHLNVSHPITRKVPFDRKTINPTMLVQNNNNDNMPQYDNNDNENIPQYDSIDNDRISQYANNYNDHKQQYDNSYNDHKPQYGNNYDNHKPQYDNNYNDHKPQHDNNYDNHKPQYTNNYNNHKPQYANNYYNHKQQHDNNYDNHKPQYNNNYNNHKPQYGNHYIEYKPQYGNNFNNNYQSQYDYNNNIYKLQYDNNYNNHKSQYNTKYNKRVPQTIYPAKPRDRKTVISADYFTRSGKLDSDVPINGRGKIFNRKEKQVYIPRKYYRELMIPIPARLTKIYNGRKNVERTLFFDHLVFKGNLK